MRNSLGWTIRPARRRGFTLLELVVAVSMMAILAALTIPAIQRYIEGANIDSTVSTLSALETGIHQFQSDISSSPFRLSQLARLVTSNDTTSCSGVAPAIPLIRYVTSSAAKWPNHGPYYPKAINVQGFPLPIGTAMDTLYRTVSNSSTGFLQIRIPGVSFDDAVLLNNAVDGSTDVNQGNRSNSTGAIQWSAPINNDFVILTYNIAVGRGC